MTRVPLPPTPPTATGPTASFKGDNLVSSLARTSGQPGVYAAAHVQEREIHPLAMTRPGQGQLVGTDMPNALRPVIARNDL